MASHPRQPDTAVRLVLRWDTGRKVWIILGTRGNQVVHETAETRVPIDRTDLIRLVGAVRNELESWLQLGPDEDGKILHNACTETPCQVGAPWCTS